MQIKNNRIPKFIMLHFGDCGILVWSCQSPAHGCMRLLVEIIDCLYFSVLAILSYYSFGNRLWHRHLKTWAENTKWSRTSFFSLNIQSFSKAPETQCWVCAARVLHTRRAPYIMFSGASSILMTCLPLSLHDPEPVNQQKLPVQVGCYNIESLKIRNITNLGVYFSKFVLITITSTQAK